MEGPVVLLPVCQDEPPVSSSFEMPMVNNLNSAIINTISNLGFRCKINTNPGYVGDEGQLGVFPHHDFITCSHAPMVAGSVPPTCARNRSLTESMNPLLLKERRKISTWLMTRGTAAHPSGPRLSEGDHIIPRKNYPCWNLICNNPPQLLELQAHEWSNVRSLRKSSFS
ncbi:inorganic pyrophosphatase 1 [Canna indica]|uniref:Inorganic pyrophosphatase 1 n=1 Tax=Canna indica TaxID=4628 RepID=A0AAQ3KM11_9LILI|nr:inorganic pyrophosphatase 1 [Canna indica]